MSRLIFSEDVDSFGLPQFEDEPLRVGLQSSHQYAQALKILQNLPDREMGNQKCAVEELRQAGLNEMAQKVSQISANEYHDFIAKELAKELDDEIEN
jgi:hypothetical protein